MLQLKKETSVFRDPVDRSVSLHWRHWTTTSTLDVSAFMPHPRPDLGCDADKTGYWGIEELITPHRIFIALCLNVNKTMTLNPKEMGRRAFIFMQGDWGTASEWTDLLTTSLFGEPSFEFYGDNILPKNWRCVFDCVRFWTVMHYKQIMVWISSMFLCSSFHLTSML